MTKDEIIQKVTILRDESIQKANVAYDVTGLINISFTIAYNNVLELLEKLEDCNNDKG
jgi:hypothetical protein